MAEREAKASRSFDDGRAPSGKRSATRIPDAIRETAERTLAQVADASAIVLFGSRARGHAEEGSDWDLMVRSPALLPHNLMVLEGIVPEDGWVRECGTIQCVSLSDYEAANHTAEDNSLAVAWSRDGAVIAGEDTLIEHAGHERLNMNERTLAEKNNAALTKMVHAWTTICSAHRADAGAEEILLIAPVVVEACEMVAKLNAYSHGVLGAKTHNLHQLGMQLREEASARREASEDARAIETMNGAAAATRLTVYGLSTLEKKKREQAEHDMRWERTAKRWDTLLALHRRTLDRLRQQDGPAGRAASDAIRKSLSMARHMVYEVASREIRQRIPKGARQATLAWMKEIEQLETLGPVPTLAALNGTTMRGLSAQRRQAKAALRKRDLAVALGLTEHWRPENLPPTDGRNRLIAACNQWRRGGETNLDEIEELMRTERRNAVDTIADAARALCAALRKAAREGSQGIQAQTITTTLRDAATKTPEIEALDVQDVETVVQGVTKAAERNELERLDTDRIVHSVIIDRTRRERETALRETTGIERKGGHGR